MLENYAPPIITLLAGFFIRHFLEPFFEKVKKEKEKEIIYGWLFNNTEDKCGSRYKSSFDIAKGTDITESRVMMLCTIHKDIKRIQENGSDLWGLYDDKSVYEEHGLIIM